MIRYYDRGGAPHIFETMLFDERPESSETEAVTSRWDDLLQRRYSTEAAAMAGHVDVLNKLSQMLMDLGSLTGES